MRRSALFVVDPDGVILNVLSSPAGWVEMNTARWRASHFMARTGEDWRPATCAAAAEARQRLEHHQEFEVLKVVDRGR